MSCRAFLLHVNINTSMVSKITENINRILKVAFVAAQNGERHAFLNLFRSTLRMSQGQEADTVSPKKQEARCYSMLFTEIIEAKFKLQTDCPWKSSMTTFLFVPLILFWQWEKERAVDPTSLLLTGERLAIRER